MATKRAAARAEAETMVDIEARLAPFFPAPVAHLWDEDDGGAEQQRGHGTRAGR